MFRRNLVDVAFRCRAVARSASVTQSLCVSRSFASVSNGNLVRFRDKEGSEHWGELQVGATVLGRKPTWTARAVEMDPVGCVGYPDDSPEVEIAELLAPVIVDPPPVVIAMGLTYKSHAEEVGHDLPRNPVYAYKSPMSVVASGTPISVPPVAREKPEVDFEAELALVIGRKIRDVTPEEGFNAIFGVTAANDVTARRWQGKKGGGQWSRSKSFDTFCPLGPTLLPLVKPDVVAALQPGGAGLQIRSLVNGNVMQDGTTSDMIFGFGEIVSYLSQGTTLLPGTVILTGTPAGVGYVRKPPVYLKPGDQVDIELEGVGTLSNIVAED